MSDSDQRASDAEMTALLGQLASNTGDDIAAIDRLLIRYDGDARLHFLKGSVLAGAARPLEAYRSLSKAVEKDPDFAIARFQLGFFELTSGEPNAALHTWQRLDALADGHYLRAFVDGLRALIADRFTECIALLQAGIAANQDNGPLNNDMQLIITTCLETIAADPAVAPATDDTVSATAMLLGRFGQSGSSN